MRKRGLIFSLLSIMCIGLTAGCEDVPTHYVEAMVVSKEYGDAVGTGNYEMGSRATIAFYPNLGCYENGASSLSRVDFTRQGEETSSNVASKFQYNSDEKYFYNTFEVTNENIGRYVATFDCKSNQESTGSAIGLRYEVRYIHDLSSGGTKVSFDLDKFLADGESKNPNNIEFVKAGEKIDYIKYPPAGIEGEMEWRIGSADSGSVFDPINTPVTSNLVLYGKLLDKDGTEIVASAINEFKKATNLKVTNITDNNENRDYAIVRNFNKSDGEKNIIVKYNGDENYENGETYYIIDKGNYYDYKYVYGYYEDELTKESIPLTKEVYFKFIGNDSANIELKDLYNVYKYIEVADVSLKEVEDKLVLDDKYTVSNSTIAEIGDVDCVKYDLSVDDKLYMSVYIYAGKIVGVETYDEKSESMNKMLYEYIENPTGESGKDTVVNMYLLRLYSDNEELNNLLTEKGFNSGYDNLLKLIPLLNDTVKSKINSNSELKEILRRYSYDIHTYDENTCTNVLYDGSVSNHYDLCIKIKGNFDDMLDSLEILKRGGFDISVTVKVLGETVSKSYKVDLNSNIFEHTNAPDEDAVSGDINDVLWDVLTALKNLNSEDESESFAKFETEIKTEKVEGIDVEYTWNHFYKKDTDTIPYISVLLDDLGRFSEILYYAKDGSKIITYPVEFDYESYDSFVEASYDGIKSVLNGNYIFSDGEDSIILGEQNWDNIVDIEDNYYDENVSWFLKLMFRLKQQKMATTVVSGDNKVTFIFMNGDKYEFVLDSGKVVEFTYYEEEVVGEEPIYVEKNNYTFDYDLGFKAAIDNLVLKDDSSYVVNGYEIISDYFADNYFVTHEEPTDDAEKEEYLFVKNFISILTGLADYTFEVNGEAYVYTTIEGNVYKFYMSGENLDKLEYYGKDEETPVEFVFSGDLSDYVEN